jgi:hypothetical protein
VCGGRRSGSFQTLLTNQPQLSLGIYFDVLHSGSAEMQRRLEGFAFKTTEVRLAEAFSRAVGRICNPMRTRIRTALAAYVNRSWPTL